jgi:hypothetical protein
MKFTHLSLLAATSLAICLPAHAKLGAGPTWGASSSSNSTSTQSIRRMSAISTPYTVNESTLTGGTVVREYIGQSGTVFAVVWQGAHVPDLSALLGDSFPTYVQSLNQLHASQGTALGPADVERSDLVVQSGGHMGAYVGRAWLPSALPAGVSTDDIQ